MGRGSTAIARVLALTYDAHTIPTGTDIEIQSAAQDPCSWPQMYQLESIVQQQ